MSSFSDVAQSARHRIARRLLPFLFLLYLIAYLDRVNVGYAALEMAHDLHFSDAVTGLGGGIFFIGYVLLEIPGAIIVERWSARRWIARIMVSWGIATIVVGLVHTPFQFYSARFLLGAAEAGFFPGMVVYLTHWFVQEDRAKAIATFMTATAVANIVGGPLASQILPLHWHSLPGWRWLFILEGVPALIFGVVTLFYLTDWPNQARWLPKEETEWINAELDREKQHKAKLQSLSIWQALGHGKVLLLALIYFMGSTGIYGFVFWFPTILKRASGLSTGSVALLAALPYLAALLSMIFNGWHSDRTGERRLHTAVPLLVGAVSMVLALVFSSHTWIQFTFFTLYAAAVYGYQPIFWTLPTAFLSESAAAASIGLINSVGGLGGFVGPYIIGFLSNRTGSFVPGLCWLLLNLSLGGVLVLRLRSREHATPAQHAVSPQS